MTRENAAAKARRYLTEGRVVLERVDDEHVIAHVRGHATFHTCTHGRGGWACTCQARGVCSHLLAVGLVTAPSRSNPTRRTT